MAVSDVPSQSFLASVGHDCMLITPEALAALDRLREGNRRAVANQPLAATGMEASRLAILAKGQQPFAVVLGCSDSRVPVEAVFDQSAGDLFVVRVAGNVAAPTEVGSIEYAVGNFGIRLVVVLGHSHCGGVVATLDAVRSTTIEPTGPLAAVIDQLRPPVQAVLDARGPRMGAGDAEVVARAVRANVHHVVARLQSESSLLARAVADQGLAIVGAEYGLATGRVEFFDKDDRRLGV